MLEAANGIIDPTRKEYLGYSKEEALTATDINMQFLENKYAQAKKSRVSFTDKFKNGLKRKETYKFSEYLSDREFLELCKYDYDMYRVKCIIYINDREEKINCGGVLSGIKKVEDAVSLYQEAIFFLRRLEFSYLLPQSNEFQLFIRTHAFSYVFWSELICSDQFYDKLLVAVKWYEGLMQCGLKGAAVMFLFYTADKLNKPVDVVLNFTKLLLDAGEIELGEKMIFKVENPSEEIVKLQKLLGEKVKTINPGERNE